MSVVTFESFLPAVAPLVPDCPDLVILDALRKASNQFCRESALWTVTNDAQSAVADEGEYDIDSPTGTVPVILEAVSYNGVPLTAKTPSQLDALIVDWANASGLPTYYVRSADDVVRLVPMPESDAEDAIVMRVAVAPDPLTGIGVEDIVANKFYEAIAAGALARLLLMPGKWANPQFAQIKAAEFRAAIGDARAVAYAANSSAQLRVRGRRFI